MTLTPRERERLDALVGAYRRLPKPEPSPGLDAAVLANARAGLAKRGRPRWPGLLATAATLTIAVGLAWQLRTADRRVESEATQAVAPAAQSVPAPAPADDGALRDAPVPVDEPTASDAALAKKPQPEAARPATAPPPTATAAAAAPAHDAAAAPKALAEPFPAQEGKAEARADAAVSGRERGQAAPVAPMGSQPILEEQVRDPAPQVEAAPAPPPPAPAREAPVAAPAERATAGKAGETSAPPEFRQPAAPAARDDAPEAITVTGSRRRATSESAPSVAGANATLGATTALREPRAWLDDIERLLREGRREQAIVELERFRAAYPDYELPRALRDLDP